MSLVLPLLVLGFWLVRGLLAGESLAAVLQPMIHSLLVSGLAGVLVLAASAPLAVLAVRYPGRLSRGLDRLSYLGYVLPGIVVALALVYFGIHRVPFLYQTSAMLLLAYLVLFLPLATGALKTSLHQVHPRLEEAARSLGETGSGAFRRVTLPLLRPGLQAGFVLVFLTVMKELPATLVLAPLDFTTLATAVWSAVSEAFFARAALPALLLIVLSSLPLIFIMNREYDL
jgi:iron(III) transport system permease protein